MLSRFFTARGRTMGGTTGIFLTLWLTLFCHHCLAGIPSLKPGSDRGAPVFQTHHQGTTAPDCDGRCLDVHALQQDTPVGQTWLAASPYFHAFVPLPPASTDWGMAGTRNSFPLFRPPDDAVRHPLSLTSIQTE